MKKNGILNSVRSAIDQARSSLESLGEERKALRRERDAVADRLRDCINRPLSKAAMIELCARMVDNKAAAYKEKFSCVVAADCMKIEAYGSGKKRPLVLADVDYLSGRGHMLPEPDGGPAAENGQGIFSWWINPSLDTCYFFGDVIKAKLPELWAGVTLPHEDDGKSLVQLEDEAAQLREELAKAEAKLSVLNADLNELREEAKMEPDIEPSPPEEENTGAFTWDLARGLQPVARKEQAYPLSASEHTDEC